jgi:hypothetical protein
VLSLRLTLKSTSSVVRRGRKKDSCLASSIKQGTVTASLILRWLMARSDAPGMDVVTVMGTISKGTFMGAVLWPGVLGKAQIVAVKWR